MNRTKRKSYINVSQLNLATRQENTVRESLPLDQKDIERSVKNKLIFHLSKRGRKLITLENDRENPDFILLENEIKIGVELSELVSKQEAQNRNVISLDYEIELQKTYGEDFQFDFLPDSSESIPPVKKQKGKELLKEIVISIEKFTKEKLFKKDSAQCIARINPGIKIQFAFNRIPSIIYPQVTNDFYTNLFTKLRKKWLADYKIPKSKYVALVLYREGSHLDKDHLRKIVQELNKKFTNKFNEIWYIHLKPLNLDIVEQLYP